MTETHAKPSDPKRSSHKQVLFFGEIAKIMTSKEYANSYSADGAPPGVYAGNMSQQDKERWKGKIVGTKDCEDLRVEIRTTCLGANLVAIVTSKGAKPPMTDSQYIKPNRYIDRVPGTTKISTNGPLVLDKEGLRDLNRAIQEAQDVLEVLEGIRGDSKAVRAYVKDAKTNGWPLRDHHRYTYTNLNMDPWG